MNNGEFPGYEFEVPRAPRRGPRPVVGHDSLRQLHYEPQHTQPAPRTPVRTAGKGVFAVMRGRNWLMGLAAPVMAAIVVGIAVVVVAGGSGGNGAAPSALAAGFPPARLAGADFTGTSPQARVVLDAVAASAATEVAAGSADGGPAVWASADGGTKWNRAALAGPASLTEAGTGQLTGIAHGAAGWLAVGTTRAGAGGPLVASSPDARTWTMAGHIAGVSAAGVVAAATAAGRAGYVIVGHRSASAGGGATTAVAWSAPGLAGWTQADVAGAGGAMMNAVTATPHGFAAVGAAGSQPAAWLSAAGRNWRQVTLPQPAGADRAALEYVAANGVGIVAVGTEFTASGVRRPFAEASANGGASWAVVQLPVPAIGPGTGTTVTALTAAGGGFTAAGTYVTGSGPEVVVWTLSPGTPVTAAAGWSTVTPQGIGLAGTGAQNALTALTAQGATLTGVGFTVGVGPSGTPGGQQATLWQSPIRY